MSIFGRIFKKKEKKINWEDNPDISERYYLAKEEKLVKSIDENIKKIKEASGSSYDLSFRSFKAGKLQSVVIHIDGMINSVVLQETLRNVMIESGKMKNPAGPENILSTAVDNLLTVNELREADNLADLFKGLYMGEAAFIFEGNAKAILCDTKGWEKRSVIEPDAELTIRGPREGFVEALRVNTSMIRRRIRVPHLWIESSTIGKLTQTEVAFAYIKGLAGEQLIQEVRSRLGRIDIDGILESGYIESFIQDTQWTFFPLTYRTERPDKVCASLLEGRVAIFIDGTPHVLIVPTELPMLMQAPDDYYDPFLMGSFIRFLRYVALAISLVLPGFYVAVINFHPELLPTELLLRIVSTREGVPFPVVFEMLLMDLLFEILREAGIRLPAAIGPAISIVGALILGDAAIQAGLVSPVVVIVVALTAIAGFSTPTFSLGISFRILRFGFTIVAAVFGLFGVQFLMLYLLIHLASLRSFGIPYLSPLAPMIIPDMKDNLIRLFWPGMQKRPTLLNRQEPTRQPPGQVQYPGKGSQEPGEEDHKNE